MQKMIIVKGYYLDTRSHNEFHGLNELNVTLLTAGKS